MLIIKSILVNNLNGNTYEINTEVLPDTYQYIKKSSLMTLDDLSASYKNYTYQKCIALSDESFTKTAEQCHSFELWKLLSKIVLEDSLIEDYQDYEIVVEFIYNNHEYIYRLIGHETTVEEFLHTKALNTENSYEEIVLKSQVGETDISLLPLKYRKILSNISLSNWCNYYDFTSDIGYRDTVIDKHFECQAHYTDYFETLSDIMACMFTEIDKIEGHYMFPKQEIRIYKTNGQYTTLETEQDIDIINICTMYAEYFEACFIKECPILINLTECLDYEIVNFWFMLTTKYNEKTQVFISINSAIDINKASRENAGILSVQLFNENKQINETHKTKY